MQNVFNHDLQTSMTVSDIVVMREIMVLQDEIEKGQGSGYREYSR